MITGVRSELFGKALAGGGAIGGIRLEGARECARLRTPRERRGSPCGRAEG